MKHKKNGKLDIDSDDIENYGILEIDNYFKGHSRVRTNLAKQDKGPFWDGTLFLYKEGGKIKEDYIDKVSIQSKGELVKQFKLSKYTYDIDMEDLQAYKTDGTVYFVTQIAPDDTTKLFYRLLSPTVCQNIIRAHKGQKTAAVRLEPVPDDRDAFVDKLGVFCTDCKKLQTAVGKPVFDMNELRRRKINTFKFNAPANTKNDSNALAEYLINNEVYLYAELDKDFHIEYPISELPVSIGIGNESIQDVKVNGVTYFDRFIIERFADHLIVKVGNCLTLTMYGNKEDQHKSKLNYKQQAKLLHPAVNEMEFILAINKYKHIELGALTVNLHSSRNALIKQYKAEIQGWRLFRDILDKMKVSKDLDLSILTEEDYAKISALCDTIGNNRPIVLTNQESCITPMQIGNLNLLLWLCVGNENKCLFGNYFDETVQLNYKVNEDATVPTSLFAYLTQEFWEKMDNVPFEDVVNSYKKHESSNPYIREMATEDATAWVRMSDKITEGSRKRDILLATERMFEWLAETEQGEEMKILLTIDLMQVRRRMRDLNQEEIKILQDILDNPQVSNHAKAGASILLGLKEDYEKYYSALKPDMKEAIDNDPITIFRQLWNI